jgi:hypothetical protein
MVRTSTFLFNTKLHHVFTQTGNMYHVKLKLRKLLSKFKSKSKQDLDERHSHSPKLQINPAYVQFNIDGYWHCGSCNTNYGLTYNASQHPFGKLRCPVCRSNWRSGWEVSRCFRPYRSTANDPVAVEELKGIHRQQVPYFTICPRCGLTWRAKHVQQSRRLVRECLPVFSRHLHVNIRAQPGVSLIGFSHIKCNCGARQDPASWKRFRARIDPGYDPRPGGDAYVLP